MTNYNEDFYTSDFMLDMLWDNNLQPDMVPPLVSAPPVQPNIHLDYLFNLINSANNTSLQPEDFTVGAPFVNTTGSSPNTGVVLTPNPLTGYVGTPTIYYNRIDISTILDSQIGTINLQNAVNLSDIMGQINTIYGTDFQPTDYINTPLPVANPTYPNLPLVVTIATTPTSLKYTGTYDYTLNYTAVSATSPVDLRRLIAVYTGLPPSQSVVKYSLDGSIDTTFSFLQNASAVSTFNISSSFYRNDGTLCLNGTFTLTALIAGIPQSGTYSSLIVDQTGSITQVSLTPIYSFTANSKQYANRNVPFIYSLDAVSFTRFNNAGILDTTFNSGLNYIPIMIRVADSGKIYAVSATFVGPDPYNNNVSTNMVVIDRLLSTGAVDVTFNRVYIRMSAYPSNFSSIIDIKENPNGLIAIYVGSNSGYGAGVPVPVVNGTPLVPIDSSGNSTGTWLPIISLLSNGMLSTPLVNSLNIMSGTAISAVGSPLMQDTSSMVYTTNAFIFSSYKTNPLVGQNGVQNNSFSNTTGNINLYNSNTYVNFPVYQSTFKIDGYSSDGTMIYGGTLASVNINGVNTPSKPMLSIIDPYNNAININNPMTGATPSGNISISNFFCF